MRTALIQALCDLADRDERVVLLTADLGWSVLERFRDRFPGRFLNVGVAEQNMLGIAAGLARRGYVPFCYSIATFAAMRGYEQFRNGAALHRLPVRVVGVGGGFSYGHAGPTHHAIEDYAIARALPGVAVIAPVDGPQTHAVLAATQFLDGPAYLRVDKNDYPDIPTLQGRFEFDLPIVVRPGRDVLLLATGSITHEALKAADLLSNHGAPAAVAVMPHLSFEASPALVNLIRQFSTVLTVEEATITGGLGSLAAETIGEHRLNCTLIRLGVRTCIQEHQGNRAYLLRQHGIDAASIADAALGTAYRRLAA